MARYLTCSRRQREERERRERQELERRLRRRTTKVAKRCERPYRLRTREKNKRVHAESDSDETELDEHTGEINESPSRGRRRAAEGANGRAQEHPNYRFQADLQNDEDGDRFYVIEKILKKRYDLQGNEEYLIRWQNYPPKYDSWEPRTEIERNALDMINEFNRVSSDGTEQVEVHCICKRPYRFDQGGMISCNNCKEWYHFSCLKMNMLEANSYAKYNCQECRKLDPNLKNVIKRDKVNAIYGTTPIVDIENMSKVNEDEPFTV